VPSAIGGGQPLVDAVLKGHIPLASIPGWFLDSGVFCCLTSVDTKSASILENSHVTEPPPDRPSLVESAHVRSGVDARHRPANARDPWRGHGASAMATTPRRGRH